MEENKDKMTPHEKYGEIWIKSYGRSYPTCNVCDLVEILLANDYVVLIERPSEDYYHIQYGR